MLVDHESEPSSCSPVTSEFKLTQLLVYFLLMFQTLFRLSDNAMSVLFTFFRLFLKHLGRITKNTIILSIFEWIPQNIRRARSFVSSKRDSFKKYACCPKCSSIYSLDKKPSEDTLHCSFIRFPSHPQRQHRQACGSKMYKEVKLSNGKVIYRPLLIYCYKSIKDSLQEMLNRPQFLDLCEAWRSASNDDKYCDVYDGKVWKDFMNYEGKAFLSAPFNFGLQLNIDWFQPFDHTQHSEGVIYLTVMNLPRRERFLQENVILAGVIPGPKEPQLNINSFLKPLVDDLAKLWTGLVLYTKDKSPVFVRAALLCVGCDIPAARKTCGFVGHGALRGCSKCLLEFPTDAFGDKPDYSNFNRSEWLPRSIAEHRKAALKHKAGNTKSALHEIERQSGVRYTVLVELPYFDPPRMCIIDPMHNLFLGTAKKMVEIWKEYNFLPPNVLQDVQAKVDSVITPNDLGRLPSKIASGFSGCTAEQWKNWTLYYSLFSLKGVLPHRHYECWHLFVKACYLLCRRSISKEFVEEADKLLERFCTSFVALYGTNKCTMNLHLHCHLKECIEDYGPVYAFWLFAFERMNGIMGSFHTNNRSVSVQLAQRFLDSKEYAPIKWPTEFAVDFAPLLECHRYEQGSLIQVALEPTLQPIPLPPVCESVWQSYHIAKVTKVVCDSTGIANVDLHSIYRKSKTIRCGKFVLSGQNSRHSQSSVIFAQKPETSNIYLAEVYYFAECTIVDNSETDSVWIVALKWYMEHPCRVWYGHPTQVWSCTQCTDVDFVPINYIKDRCTFTKTFVNFGRYLGTQEVIIATPIACKS